MTPAEYFENLKETKHQINPEFLNNSYQIIFELAEKYNITGQTKSLSKLKFLAQVISEEEKLLDLGINTFIYKDDIENYIDTVAGDVVKIIELRNYLREIPDEIVEVIKKTKDIFSEFYVLFTDYTGKEEKRISKERREKDPILFGCFKENSMISDRFYFLGDWIDEYCDLTLDKLIQSKVPTHKSTCPQTKEELMLMLEQYQPKTTNTNSFFINNNNLVTEQKPKSFFDKIRTIFNL